MFKDILLFMYIFAAFAGILAISLVVILIKYRDSGNKRLLSAIRNFMLCTVAINFLYFYIEYTELTGGVYKGNALTRVADICFFLGQIYFWAGYVEEKLPEESRKKDVMKKVTFRLMHCCIILAVLTYGFVMEGYYTSPGGVATIICIIAEFIICASLTFIIIWHLKAALHEMVDKKSRTYIACISIALIVNCLWNGIIVMMTVVGNMLFSAGSANDPTPIFIFITNCFTVLLVLNEQFTELFKAPEENSDGEKVDLIEQRLDYIAETHLLTNREREIMGMAYNKMTNPEIAERLCISKYTVRNHMHSIFEKLDIATRADLILFVDKKLEENIQ